MHFDTRAKVFWRPQLLKVLTFAMPLSLGLIDQVRPQFRQYRFADQIPVREFWSELELRNFTCGKEAFSCGVGLLLKFEVDFGVRVPY